MDEFQGYYVLPERKHTALIKTFWNRKISPVVEEHASGKAGSRLTGERPEGTFWGSNDSLYLDRALGDTSVKHLPNFRERTYNLCISFYVNLISKAYK